MATFTQRLIGAMKLDGHIFEEVEADTTALGQAIGVVVLSSVAAGIGAAGLEGTLGLFAGTIAALLGWAIWAWLTFFIGTRILPSPQTHADWGQLARATAFASAPGIFRVLGILPLMTGFVFTVTAVWMLAAFVIAVRHALDYTSTWRALGVCLIGWIINGVLVAVLGFLLPG